MNDRLHAVLIEPQLARFRELCGLDGEDLEANFTGWHRHAILSSDRVFLFPRNRQWVRPLLREAAVLKGLADQVPVMPRLLGQWRDAAISPYPFIAVARLFGWNWGAREREATLDQCATMLANLGRAIATWHRLDLQALPPRLRRRPPHLAEFDRLLTPEALGASARRITRFLHLSDDRAEAWLRAIAPLRHMAPVFVHGDIHEDQILVDEQRRVTGIVDWETAGVGHPLKDFDFGEWGLGIFAWEPQFDVLRRAMWNGYVAARGGDLPSWRAVHRFFCLSQFPPDDAAGDWAQTRRATILDLMRRLDTETASAPAVL